VVSGVLVYGYLALIARALPAGEYADFGAYWSIALIIGFGAFLPVELELARLLSSRPAGSPLPAGTRPAVAGLVALSMLTVLAGLPLLLPAVGGLGVVAALLALCLVSAGQFLLRGTLLGNGRLHLHGTVLVGDAALRVATATAVVLLLPDAGPAAFAWTLVTAIALAHLPLLLVLSRRRRPAAAVPGPPAPPRAFLAAIGPLLVGTLCAQVLLNAAPVLVSAVASGTEGALADRFTATFTLVRLPLFVAVPLQSALVPLLTQLSVAGGTTALRRFLLRLTAGIAALTAAGAVLGATIGPPLVRLLFGDRYALPGTATAVLAAGSGVHLGLLVVSQAVLASGRHTQVAVVWAGGLLAGGVVFAVVPDLVFRAALAFALGSAVAMLWGLLVLLRRPAAERSPQPLTPTPGGGSPP
jgi:O-antigen/teichoic acid export membrane protein